MARPLLIVDGDNLAHRAYHSTPKTVLGRDGEPINAVVGFFSMLMRLWTAESPRAVFVAWDTLGVDTYRSELLPGYQGGRVFETALVRQLDQLPKLCAEAGLGVGKAPGFEADDFMASAAKREVESGGACLILTTDRDAYQLVSESVTVLCPRRGSPVPARIDPLEVVRELGVLPEQVPCYKALCGDPSDKIPGARGIGPKTAARLLLRHGALEEAVASWPDVEAERALMFRRVALMRYDAPAELPIEGPDWLAGSRALRELGAVSLADRMGSLAS